MSELDKILEERGKEYGSFKLKAEYIQKQKDIARQNATIAPYQMEGLDNIFAKIARIIFGNPNNVDNWRDLAGYSELVVKELEAENRG